LSVEPNPDRRLDELFIRYWDDALTDAESAELERRLAADPAARDWFRFLALQVVTAADVSAVARAGVSAAPVRPQRRVSRRTILRALGAGLAATVVAGVMGRRYWPDSFGPVRLASTRGKVNVRTAQGSQVPSDGSIPADGTVSTQGFDSWAVLEYPDGTKISLAGDSVLTVVDGGRRVLLGQGNATADVRRTPSGDAPLQLATAVATLTGMGGAITTLGHSPGGTTEVGVLQGRVNVDAPSGQPLAVVREGESFVVRADGDHRKGTLRTAGDEFRWDLTQPLAEGWQVGHRRETPDGPVVVPEFWFDPYHQAEMSQIRSNKLWAPGFFRLFPESEFHVRYWVDAPGPSQLCVCVRTDQPCAPETGMMECNTAFTAARPRQWQWLKVRARDMLDNRHTPGFGPPWVGFLVILNTYKIDLGLKVAEFRVTRPGGGVATS
jgi:hypothetical protein